MGSTILARYYIFGRINIKKDGRSQFWLRPYIFYIEGNRLL